MDTGVAPGDDFFRYANGAWMRSTAIPPDRSDYGTNAILSELGQQRLEELIQGIARAPASLTSERRKIADYYNSFMDEEAIDRKGLKPLEPALRAIEAISNGQDLATALGHSLRADVDVLNNTNLYTPNLFGLWVASDLDDPRHYAPYLLQGGLGMPDRDFYLNPSPRMSELRSRYQAHIAAMLTLAGFPEASVKAARIYELEHRIAEAQWPRAQTQEVTLGNNHWTRTDLTSRAPGLQWQAFLSAAGLDHQRSFVVWQSTAIAALSALTASEPLDTWKDYLLFHSIEHAAPYLCRALSAEHFAFYGKVLAGIPTARPRWKRAVEATNHVLPDAIGKLYVQRYFVPASKRRAEEIANNVVRVFRSRVGQLEWMSPRTRLNAQKKLDALRIGIGYPAVWHDYSGLRVVRGDVLGNAERAELFEYHHELAKLGKRVNRGEWAISPQTVNAISLPVLNAINFPAALLQPPILDSTRPTAMDYGAIGALIGHEVSHSFDDQGSQFDASGRLRNWWTAEDLAHFRTVTARLEQQYDAYRPFADVAVDGKRTLSENIADVAGLFVALDAYRLAQGKVAQASLPGFSSDQLFFLSYAQKWRKTIREAALRQTLIVESHAPDEYRADAVRNLDAWYAAFDVRPDQRLYLSEQDRIRIW
jgi:predicted metalloendopeptidase